jgi:hypothetical protein
MKDPSDDIRDWLYTTLHNNVSYGGATISVYSFPPEDVSYPYILLGEQSGEGEEGAKDRWLWDVATQVTVYTLHVNSDASYVPVNTIMSAIWQRVRTSTTGDNYMTDESPVALTNFNLIRVRVGAFNTERTIEDNGVKISKQVSINLLVEEN